MMSKTPKPTPPGRILKEEKPVLLRDALKSGKSLNAPVKPGRK